jgi:CMP-N-acetylneuraminic acid synthetase
MTLGDGRRVLAIIPVRSGSKRILGKNLRLFNGKELFRWTLEAALDSKQIDKILVNTDSEDVIRIAESHQLSISRAHPLQ